MKWDSELISKLNKHYYKIAAIQNLQDRIDFLENQIYGLKPSMSTSTPVQGGSTKQEDIIINSIVEIEELKKSLNYTKYEVEFINKGLAVLSEKETKIITEMYLMSRRSGVVDTLCKDLYLSKSEVYRIKDEALYKMTIFLYGRNDNS